MKNSTNIKIPKKYENMIEEVFYEGKENGYWIYLKDGYIHEEMECGTIHEYTQKDLLNTLRGIIKLNDIGAAK